jgi:chemotaxis protein methyltransferase CheR
MTLHAGSAARPRRAQGWSDAGFSRVSEVACVVAGLVFPPNRQPSAEAGMRRVMSAFRLATPDDLRVAVSRPGEVRDALLAELTIGETYFFRESGALALLEGDILPAHRATGDLSRPLRIWSAGCASGEEPYSIAMLLREIGWHSPVRVLATDIARPRLDAARRGRYTRWSLRGVADQRIDRWFARRGQHFILDDSIRASVEFRALNLVADEYPSVASDTADQDLVLCRNVLIYFDLKTVAAIATRLLDALRPTGWLLLGASDPPLTGLVPCTAIMTAAGVAYRRADAPGDPIGHRVGVPSFPARQIVPAVSSVDVAPVHDLPAAETSSPSLRLELAEDTSSRVAGGEDAADVADAARPESAAASAYARGDYDAAAAWARSAVELDANDIPHWVVWIRALANQGELVEAGELCARAIDLHRLTPELHYLHGLLLMEGGMSAEAVRAARRALYLDRTFILAYMLLGDALARQHDVEGARRAFRNALASAEDANDDEVLDAGDGVPLSRIRQIADARLRSLGGASA